MESIAINGREVNVQGIKELRSGLSVQEAVAKTKKNGIDEIYFQVDGKNFLAYGDALKIGDLSQNKISSVTYNGRMGTVVAHENEVNSVSEGIVTGALSGFKKTKEAIFGAVGNTITSVGPTSTLAVGGALALTGLSIWRGAAAGGVAAAASPIGNILGDILKNGSIGALKVITVAGAIGFGVTSVVGAIGGVSDALSTEKDYSSIAAVTKDGNSVVQAGVLYEIPADPYNPAPTPAPVQNTQPVQNPNDQQMSNGGRGQVNIFVRPNMQSNPNMPSNDFSAVSCFLNNRSM